MKKNMTMRILSLFFIGLLLSSMGDDANNFDDEAQVIEKIKEIKRKY